MLTQRDEALKELRKELDNIKDNNRKQIHLITLMADDYGQYAEDITKLISSYIRAAPSELKLVGIYIMDSIIKFEHGESVEKYRRLFSNELIKLFVDTFKKAPIDHRRSLFKVRATWQEVLLKSKLFDLDNEVQKIDKSWPIFKQATPRAAAAVSSTKSPAVPAESKSTVVPTAASTSPTTVAAKPVIPSQPISIKARDPRLNSETSENKPPLLKQPAAKISNVSSKAPATSSPAKDVISPQSTTVIKKEVSSPEAVKNVVLPQTPSPKTLAIKVPVVKSEDYQKCTRSEVCSISTRRPIKRTPPSTADTKTIAVGNAAKQSDTVVTRQHFVPEKKRRIEDQQHHHPVQPTVALGEHAFLPRPPVGFPMPLQQPSSFPLGPMLPPQQIPKTEVIEDSWIRPPAVPLPQQQVYNQPPPPFIINSGPPPLMPSFGMRRTSAVITNETPRHGGAAAANNRIFVDGRAYEVFYLNNEAVIEQNGLPHRIFFSGPPRDVLIDGKPLKLAFDEARMIHIDGIPHQIRFGAPSRELYIGDYPFRGAFNGPPMVANINGRRHEFRLCGAPPEVRIDQDPCYELSRYMNAIRGPQQNNVILKQEEKLGKQDVTVLLQKLKQHGILNKSLTNSSKDDSKTTSIIAPQKPSSGPPRNDVVGTTAREVTAPQSLKDFKIGSLMVRYSDVVEALHRPRTACPHCGIGFADINSEAYQRHIDIHVQDLLRTKETGKSRSRPWFIGKENWLEFDEYAEVQKQATTEGTADDPSSSSAGSSQSDAIATTSLNKACTVCHEKFIEYYDNDEEEWKFQDCCIIKENVAIHRYCIEQMEDGGNENLGIGIKQEIITQKQTAFSV